MNSTVALLVQVEERFGTRYIRAHVVIPQENGELHSVPGWEYGAQVGSDFYGFTVSAYIGDGLGLREDNPGHIWGSSHYFEPHRVESAKHARAIARVYDRVERGLAKANDSAGYLREDDFHGYVLRVAASLGIKAIYVRNFRAQREMSGEKWRKVAPDTLAWFVSEVSRRAKSEPHTLVER